MPEVLDFTSLTTQHYKPAKITQITPREALKPLKSTSTSKSPTGGGIKPAYTQHGNNAPPKPQQHHHNIALQHNNAQIQREWEEHEMSELKRCSKEIAGQRRDAAILASRLLQVASSTLHNRADEFHTSRFMERRSINNNNNKNNSIEKYRPTTDNNNNNNNTFLFVHQPAYHELTLRDWEKDINWEGADNNTAISCSSSGNNADAAITNNTMICNGGINMNTSNRNVLETRFNSELFAAENDNENDWNWSKSISWLGADADPAYNEELARNIPLILDANVAGNSLKSNIYQSYKMSFAENIIFSERIKKEMSSSGSAATHIGGNVHTFVSTAIPMHASQEELAEIIAEKQEKRAKMAVEKASRVTDAMKDLDLGAGKGRTITSSLMGPGGTERTGRPTRHIGASSHYDTELVEHLDIVYNHVFVRPDLRRSEMRQFHRPRLTWQLAARANRPWMFQIKPNEFKLSAGVDGEHSMEMGMGYSMNGHNMMGNMSMPSNLAQMPIRTKADLSPADGHLVLFEYCVERPPLILSKGMACKIVNFYRGDPANCPMSAGGGARPLKKKKKKQSSKSNDHGAKAALDHAQVEKPAKLMGPQSLEQQCAVSSSDGSSTKNRAAATLQELLGLTQKQKLSSSDQQDADAAQKKKEEEEANKNIYQEGVTEILQSGLHGPFLGAIEDNSTQSGMLCNLFSAPLFQHKPQSSDFLMVLNKSKRSSGSSKSGGGENGISVLLREMPSSMFCVGQTEPRVKVFAPRTAGEKNFANPFMTYQIAKALQRSELEVEEQGLSFEDISERVFANTTIQATALRQRIRSVADYDKNTSIWRIKPVGQDDFHGVETLGRKISPEGVSAYESACAACRRLTDLGIHDLHTGSSSVTTVGSAMMYLTGAMAAAKSRYNSVNKRANMFKTSKRKGSTAYEKAAEKLKTDLLELRRKHEVAKFIYEELQLAPWHTTNEFIEVHKNAQGSGMMKLTGLGDPSGLGEGYSFLREMDPKPNKASNSDGALNEQINKITGTQNDLRRLTMKQMADLLRSYGMKDPDIKKLKRWDRVHVIRDLATRDAADGMGDVDGKFFARGEKMKLSDQKEMYRQRIQEIWRRQVDALSTDPGDIATKSSAPSEAGTEEDDDDDLSSDDDFAKDLEDEMMDVRKTNEILQETTGLAGRKANQNKEMSGDARDLVALQRDLKEERAVEKGLAKKDKSKDDSAVPIIDPDRKVVRRKITRMHPDGTTTVTFKFILSQSEVENVITAKATATSSSKKKKSRMSSDSNAAGYHATVGHAMFEDEDDMIVDKRSIKFQITTSADGKISKRPYPPKAMPKSSRAKVNISMLNQRASAEKKSRKRQRAADERDIYSNARIRTGTSNRRERGAARDRMPHMKFADRLKEIQLQVEKRPNVGAFLRPVDRRQIPRYYEVISQPIDLSTIRNKNTQCEYRTVDAFIDEFELMKNNAIKFNGPTSFLAKEATAIYDFVKNQIEKAREEFHVLELAVKEQLSGTRKKKSRGGSKKKEKKSSTASSSNTANVVVNGVATTVDLGDIGDFAGDSD